MQVLQAVVVRQILYPTTFGNMGDKELNVIQNQMEGVIKKKLRYPRHMKNAVLYGHEQAGGVGLDHIQTLVNVNRLILLMNCLSQGGAMKKNNDRRSAEITGIRMHRTMPVRSQRNGIH